MLKEGEREVQEEGKVGRGWVGGERREGQMGRVGKSVVVLVVPMKGDGTRVSEEGANVCRNESDVCCFTGVLMLLLRSSGEIA